ncbi:MAG TPA: sigma-54 dependent transcriptional regulator [Polyangiaceae bacterium]|nr:sigma-54 dependent transcriptional regulator [Polyangiaceae bacterium]
MNPSADAATEPTTAPNRALKILIVGDCARSRDLLCGHLSDAGHSACTQNSTSAALDLAAAENFDVVVVAANESQGPEAMLRLCEQVRCSLRGVPFIVVTEHSNLATAVAAVRVGAFDLLSGTTEPKSLVGAVERAAQRPFAAHRPQLGRSSAAGFSEIVGSSPAVLDLVALLTRISDLDAPVLLNGEVGTGKAQLARSLHQRSRRSQAPFLTLNCAAAHETLLESELFGQSKNANPNTGLERVGLLARAGGGTLFLDEISELPLRLQSRLLTALQEQRFTPVGGDDSQPCNVRLIAATRRNLENDIGQERFRADLYYWIGTLQVQVPPLRERAGDVLIYAQLFVERFAQSSGKALVGLSQQAAERLLCYDWPGNLRELRNCIDGAASLTQRDFIDIDDLPDRIRFFRRSHIRVAAENQPFELATLDEVERQHVLRVLETTGGNKTLAAQILGVDRRTLHRKCERYTG